MGVSRAVRVFSKKLLRCGGVCFGGVWRLAGRGADGVWGGWGGGGGGGRGVLGGGGLDGMGDEAEGRRGWRAWASGVWVDEFTGNAGGAPDGGRRGGRSDRSAARRERRRGSGEWEGWFDRLSRNGDRIVKNADRIRLSQGRRRGGSGAKQAEGIWNLGCKAYPASVHYLGTDGNHRVVGDEGMLGTARGGRRVRAARPGRGRGVAWPRMASTAGRRL